MRRLLILALALCALYLAGCGDDDKPTKSGMSLPRVAYIHQFQGVYEHPAEFKAFLDSSGYPTTLILKDTLPNVVWARFSVIIIDDRCSDMFVFGTAEQIAAVQNARLPVLGIGLGGASYFRAVDSAKTWSYGVYTYLDSLGNSLNHLAMNVADASIDTADVVFSYPVDVLQPDDTLIEIQTRGFVSAMQAETAMPDTVVCVGRAATLTGWFTAMKTGTKSTFFGYGGSVVSMTTTGRSLLTNLLYDLTH